MKKWTLQDELNSVMRFEYKTIDISKIEGIERVEKLMESGWEIIANGLFTVTLEKEG